MGGSLLSTLLLILFCLPYLLQSAVLNCRPDQACLIFTFAKPVDGLTNYYVHPHDYRVRGERLLHFIITPKSHLVWEFKLETFNMRSKHSWSIGGWKIEKESNEFIVESLTTSLYDTLHTFTLKTRDYYNGQPAKGLPTLSDIFLHKNIIDTTGTFIPLKDTSTVLSNFWKKVSSLIPDCNPSEVHNACASEGCPKASATTTEVACVGNELKLWLRREGHDNFMSITKLSCSSKNWKFSDEYGIHQDMRSTDAIRCSSNDPSLISTTEIAVIEAPNQPTSPDKPKFYTTNTESDKPTLISTTEITVIDLPNQPASSDKVNFYTTNPVFVNEAEEPTPITTPATAVTEAQEKPASKTILFVAIGVFCLLVFLALGAYCLYTKRQKGLENTVRTVTDRASTDRGWAELLDDCFTLRTERLSGISNGPY